ncbi:hypothetical protein EAY56_27270, partial [Vibrio anguillarum]|nr:hypothetical protein [Vibrio anguillarum]
PKQNSTGGKNSLSALSKSGNRALRTYLFMVLGLYYVVELQHGSYGSLVTRVN